MPRMRGAAPASCRFERPAGHIGHTYGQMTPPSEQREDHTFWFGRGPRHSAFGIASTVLKQLFLLNFVLHIFHAPPQLSQHHGQRVMPLLQGDQHTTEYCTT